MADLKYGALGLQVIEDFGVHLDRHLIALTEDRVQAIVKHPRLLLAVRESQHHVFIFIEDRSKHDQVESIFKNLRQNAPSVNLLDSFFCWVLGLFGIRTESVVVDPSEVLDVLDAFLKVGDSVNENRQQRIKRNLAIDECLAVHEARRRLVTCLLMFL